MSSRQICDSRIAGYARPTGAIRRHLVLASLAIAGIGSPIAATTPPSFAQAVRADFDRPYGPVLSVAISDTTLYLGGDFHHVGPLTGSVVTLSKTTGRLVDDFGLYGYTNDCIPDGEGGWYFAGNFGSGGGNHLRVVLHIRADGSFGPLNPNVNGPVYALARDGGTLYVGGDFTNINGNARIRVAAIDLAADTVTAWDAKLGDRTSRFVAALAVAHGLLYIGGAFEGVGVVASRTNAAAVDLVTAALAPWNPAANEVVDDFAVGESVVFMAGAFSSVSGIERLCLAAVDATSGAPTPWNPVASNRCTELELKGNTVYVGGGFHTIGGSLRGAFAAIDATTGQVRPWPSAFAKDPGTGQPSVAALTFIGSTLYVGGEFTSISGEPRQNIAAFDTTTGELTSWNPGATNRISILASHDSLIFAGGGFDRIGGPLRHRLAAIGTTSGRTTSWNPAANDIVRALAVRGSTVYAGGSFGRIGGEQHLALAAIDAETGAPSPAWTATANGTVRALELKGPNLYVGGSFTQIGGQPRSRLAALDATTGVLTAWQPEADSTVRALVAGDSTIYVGGDFDHVHGAARMRVAAIDSSTGNVVPWNALPMGLGENVYAIALEGPTLYVGGNFSTLAGQSRRNLGALDIATGSVTGWHHDFEKSVYAFGEDGNHLYVGAGGDFEEDIAALDPITGWPSTWSPPIYGSVFCLATDDTYVYAGGERGLFAIAAPNVTATLLSLFRAEATPEGIVLRWQFSGSADDPRFRLERSEPSSDTWTLLGDPIRNDAGIFMITDRGAEAGRTYHYRLILQVANGSMTFGPIEASMEAHDEVFALTRVSPSPTAGPVAINFVVPRATLIRLDVLDIQGRVTATLLDGWVRPGSYEAIWSGRSVTGPAPVGIYFVRFEAEGRRMTKRLVVHR